MTITSKRAEYIALVSSILSIIFFGMFFILGKYTGYFAIFQMAWLCLTAAGIWTILWIQFHQRALAEQEKLDIAQAVNEDKSSTIFQAKNEQTMLAATAQRRLKIFEKWFIPIFSSIIAVYQIFIGLFLLSDLRNIETGPESGIQQSLLAAVCLAAIAFVTFLISRYATGMSLQTNWKPLRAGGSIFLAIAIICFFLAIALALAHFELFILVRIIDFVIPILLLLLGGETALNVIFDIYRPRIKGQYTRSAFDSRLLGVINEPGGLFHTAAAAIDYQFGFKVSQTWFYKLLEKAIVPLIILSIFILYLFTCIVIVGPQEQAAVEVWGSAIDNEGNPRIYQPGVSLKLPWPFGIARTYPVKRIEQINIGFEPEIDPRTGQEVRQPRLWGKDHYKQEYNLLVASEQTSNLSDSVVPVSIVRAAVPVQFRVKDLYAFLYNHSSPVELLEFICYQQLTKFASTATIDVDNPETVEYSLLGAGRAKAKDILTKAIQQAADQHNLGVEIVFVGLQGIHPPPDVAEDYQKVISAVQQKQAEILSAQAERNKVLSELAGSVEQAQELYNLITDYQKAEDQKDTQKINALASNLDSAFLKSQGQIFNILRQAYSYAFEKATLSKAAGLQFESQLQAYHSAKDIYKHQHRLAAMEEALEKIRKFVVISNENDTQVFMIDVQEKLVPDLYDLGALKESTEK